MKILITGGTGFLGSRIGHRLARDGHDVTVLRRATSKTDALAGLSIRHEIGDVTDLQSLQRAVAGQEIVIHAAAGRSSGPDSERTYDVNASGTRNVADACMLGGVRRMVHVSSVAAIGIPADDTPASETFAFNLHGSRLYYHLSKYRSEEVVRAAVARGLDAVVVNPASIWGPFGSSYRGADIIRIVQRARVVRTSSGGMCIVHVDDVVSGIVAAMQSGAAGQRYILGGDNLHFRDWVEQTALALGANVRTIPVPAFVTEALALVLKPLSAAHPRFYGPYLRSFLASRSAFYDSGKASTALDYQPRPFTTIVREAAGFLGRARKSSGDQATAFAAG